MHFIYQRKGALRNRVVLVCSTNDSLGLITYSRAVIFASKVLFLLACYDSSTFSFFQVTPDTDELCPHSNCDLISLLGGSFVYIASSMGTEGCAVSSFSHFLLALILIWHHHQKRIEGMRYWSGTLSRCCRCGDGDWNANYHCLSLGGVDGTPVAM